MIATFVSVILMTVAIFIGGLAHSLFRGSKKEKWDAPEWLGLSQMLIIQGLCFGIIATVVGHSFNWGWLTVIGSFLTGISSVILGLDLLVLIIIASIYGKFDIAE